MLFKDDKRCRHAVCQNQQFVLGELVLYLYGVRLITRLPGSCIRKAKMQIATAVSIKLRKTGTQNATGNGDGTRCKFRKSTSGWVIVSN